MISPEVVGVGRMPGEDELRSFRRGAGSMIVLARNELMNSRMSGSDEALATLACARLRGRPQPHLLNRQTDKAPVWSFWKAPERQQSG
jgi:hypothetical protein